jgi:hypothetical protein
MVMALHRCFWVGARHFHFPSFRLRIPLGEGREGGPLNLAYSALAFLYQ